MDGAPAAEDALSACFGAWRTITEPDYRTRLPNPITEPDYRTRLPNPITEPDYRTRLPNPITEPDYRTRLPTLFMKPLTDPTHRESAFLLYATFAGDAVRTAAALNLSEEDVRVAADVGKWDQKLASIIALRRSAAPGDIERAINRALAFVQGHRLRMQLDRVLLRLELMTENDLDEYILPAELTKAGQVVNKLSTRPFTDLAAAVEKANAVCSIALSDTAQDRARREESEQGGESSGAIHAAIAKAMAEVGNDNSPTALLFEAQAAVGEAVAKDLAD